MSRLSKINLKTCWMCSVHPATTREHRVLKARLDLIDYRGKGLIVQTPHSKRPTIAQGSKSSSVKFGKTLCIQCNGDRSQKWDKAYLEFVKYGVNNPNYLRDQATFSWSEHYPSLRADGPALARYYAKQVGCRIVNEGRKIPSSIRDFLLDDTMPSPFSLWLVEDYDWLDLIEIAAGRFDYPIIKVESTIPIPPSEVPNCVLGLFHEGPYGILFYFDSSQSLINNFATQRSSYIQSRNNLPEFTDRLWVTQDNHRRTVEKFIREGRVKELYDSPDFLNILNTHD